MPDATATLAPQRSSGDDHLGDAAAVFGGLRSRLIGIAHRIVGSWSEAEDVVQDVWLRWQLCDRATVLNPTAFLVTTTTRLAINVAQSARVRRESHVGEWLPEPVATGEDPALEAERREGLQLGIRMLLERLTPTERAAYVLREAFGYPYPEIADMLQTSEANARQLTSRASKHIAGGRQRSVSPHEQLRLLHAFVSAARYGEVDDLEQLFAAA